MRTIMRFCHLSHWNSNYSEVEERSYVPLIRVMCEGCPRDGVPEMTTQSAQFDEPVEDLRGRYEVPKELRQLEQDLREHYEVPKELPRELRTLVRKLDDTPSPLWSSLRELHNAPPPSSKSWLAELAAEWDAMLNAWRQDHPEDRAQD
jgi:hypothetical protein